MLVPITYYSLGETAANNSDVFALELPPLTLVTAVPCRAGPRPVRASFGLVYIGPAAGKTEAWT
jgi:hypothetical protein